MTLRDELGMCILAGDGIITATVGRNDGDNYDKELTSKFQKIFFGGHRIVWGLIRIMAERGQGRTATANRDYLRTRK